jgi:hypothetical protein
MIISEKQIEEVESSIRFIEAWSMALAVACMFAGALWFKVFGFVGVLLISIIFLMSMIIIYLFRDLNKSQEVK